MAIKWPSPTRATMMSGFRHLAIVTCPSRWCLTAIDGCVAHFIDSCGGEWKLMVVITLFGKCSLVKIPEGKRWGIP